MTHTHMAMPACTDAHAYTCVQMCAFTPMTHTYMAMPTCTDAHAQMHRPGHRHYHGHSTGTEIRDPSSGLESGKATAPGRPQESPLSVPHSSQRKPRLSSNLELEPSFPAPPLGDTDFPALLPPPPGPAPGWPQALPSLEADVNSLPFCSPSLLTTPHPVLRGLWTITSPP